MVVALYLDPPENVPTLADLAAALVEPARPLFLGRKPCLPAGWLCAGIVTAGGLVGALASLPAPIGATPRTLLPSGESFLNGDEQRTWSDLRDWRSGVHGGTRTVFIRTVRPEKRPPS